MEVLDRIKHFFPLKLSEISELLIGAVMMAFMLSFREWGETTFSLSVGFGNLIDAFLVMLLVFLIHVTTQKVIGLARGYEVTYRVWFVGLFIGIIATFFSNGAFFFFLPGGITVKSIRSLAIGRKTIHPKLQDRAVISYTGILISLIIALLFSFSSFPLLYKGFVGSLLLAVGSMLPLPQLEQFVHWEKMILGLTIRPDKIFKPRTSTATMTGLHILYYSRPWFIFCFLFTMLTSYFIFVHNIPAIITAIVVAFVAAIMYYFWKEI